MRVVRTLAKRTPDGPAPPPPVQRLRIRYVKRGRLRFTSHRDIQRAFERALRRAEVPMAYSAGFSPHPKISWAGAAPTGTASEAEYVEIAVAKAVDPATLRAALDGALPPGLDVLEVVEAGPGPLADRLEASVWRIELPGIDREKAWRVVSAFLAADHVEVDRLTKAGMRTFDARPAVLSLRVRETAGASGDTTAAARAVATPASPSPACAILELVVRHATPAVRPDDVLIGLGTVGGLELSVPARVIRMAQGPLAHTASAAQSADGTGVWLVGDPMAPDRSASTRSEPPSIEPRQAGV